MHNSISSGRLEDATLPNYPENIRDIVVKMTRREDLTFKEANDAVKVLRRMLCDISELLEQAHNEMQNSLMPVVAAADYLKQITDNKAKDAALHEKNI